MDKTWVQMCMDLFAGSRKMTKEESEVLNRAMLKRAIPTGHNLWDDRIDHVFTCPLCHRTKDDESAQFCSSGFHLTIPESFVMRQGKIIPKKDEI